MDKGDTLQSIGKYEILGTLGRGSQGVVYKARDPEIGRIVALKTLRKVLSSQPRSTDLALDRFRTEARSAGNLRHPNIITIFEVSIDGDIPYIVMDYIEGESLDTLVSKNGRLDPTTAIRYLAQVASALDYAHSKGVIHRDIKPSNVLIDRHDTAYVLDFGIAKIEETLREGAQKISPVMGTPGYMSPEQILNEEVDYRSDLFSFAIVAFQCFTGQRPFLGGTFNIVVSNIIEGKHQALTSLVKDLPLSLETEFERALARKKEDRFQSATDLVKALGNALGIDPSTGKVNTASNRGYLRGRKNSIWKSLTAQEKIQERDALTNRENLPTSSQSHTRGSFRPWGGVERPGDAFIGAGSFKSHEVIHRDKFSSFFTILTVVAGILCIAVGGTLVWLMISESSPSGDSMAKEGSQIPYEHAASIKDELVHAQIDTHPVPAGKSVGEMTDDEILSVLVNQNVPDIVILDALVAGLDRKLAKLPEAAARCLVHDSYVVRIEAIKTFVALGDRRAVPELLSMLDDHDPLVRGHAAKALGALGGKSAVGYLMAKYSKEEVPEVKSAIKNSIEKINGFPMKE